jgi:hypothetical protein
LRSERKKKRKKKEKKLELELELCRSTAKIFFKTQQTLPLQSILSTFSLFFFNHWVYYDCTPNTTCSPAPLNALADAEACALSAECLSRLAAASYREDDLGTVQHTLVAVISAMLAALAALERRTTATVDPAAVQVASVLGTALHRIIVTFYEDIPALGFAPADAARLKILCEFGG